MNSGKFKFQMKHFYKIYFLFSLLLFIPSIVNADNRKIHGVVVDETGECLIGATIKEKGTNNATITNYDGLFTIEVTSSKPVLEVSYVGYETVSYPVTSNKVKIVMSVSTVSLDAVVVVAYGTQKKVTVTGSIASIGNDEIKKSSAPNITAAIAGKLPGLSTIQTNGAPGKDDVTMFLRGAATYNDTNPLILVDGIPR